MIKVKWEYRVIRSYGISDERIVEWEEELNKRGEEGWELVSVIVRPEVPAYESAEDRTRVFRTVVFLKREKVVAPAKS